MCVHVLDIRTTNFKLNTGMYIKSTKFLSTLPISISFWLIISKPKHYFIFCKHTLGTLLIGYSVVVVFSLKSQELIFMCFSGKVLLLHKVDRCVSTFLLFYSLKVCKQLLSCQQNVVYAFSIGRVSRFCEPFRN